LWGYFLGQESAPGLSSAQVVYQSAHIPFLSLNSHLVKLPFS
jgi:hypothetical protein